MLTVSGPLFSWKTGGAKANELNDEEKKRPILSTGREVNGEGLSLGKYMEIIR